MVIANFREELEPQAYEQRMIPRGVSFGSLFPNPRVEAELLGAGNGDPKEIGMGRV